MKRKILAAFLLALIAIGMALTITHFSFSEMMGTVDQLSAPNEKLIRLNKVFQEITMLDQQQRAEAIQNPQKPYKYFLDQTGYLGEMIDSLQNLPWDSVQQERLASMREILDQRNQLFVAYLKVKAELGDNKEFSQQLDTLSALLLQSQKSTDSIVTTQRQTITRYIQEDSLKEAAKDRNFLKKLFGKKKDRGATSPVKLKEETNVTIDTVAIARQGIDLHDIQRRISELETDQRSQRKRLQEKELELIHANSLFINQLLNTLHEVENEELQNMRASNDRAAQVVNEGISRMHILMLSFFLAAALLVYLILLDISKSNYYRAQLEKARDQAEELGKIKQRFLANMSHEIRTPLQSIIGFSEQLMQENRLNRDAVNAIHSSSEHLLQIVNEVLDYSRISSGTLTLKNEKFRLLTLVKEVEGAMRIQAHRKNLTFIIDTEKASDQYLFGDAFRLRQILYNLLGNAIKFTHKGFIRLSVSTQPAGNEKVTCVFEVTDSGIGMSEQEIARIFNQFEQANPEISRTYGGTGLGLSIVKSLIDAQQGRLEVNSRPGAGSTFRVTLSFAVSEDEKHLTEKADNVRLTAGNTRALIIDDDTMIIKLCGLILSRHGIDHRLFHSAASLLDLNPDPSVTHVLIDIRMPDINGVELCRQLKKKYPTTTRFVALTAHVLPEERETLLDQGFDSVLPKPFTESHLVEVLGVYATPSSDGDGLPDFAAVRNMTMGDEKLFQSIMRQFAEETHADITVLERTLPSRNAKAIREVVHKMTGRLGQVGLTSLSVRLRNVEKHLAAGKKVDDIYGELRSLAEEIRAMLKNLRRAQRSYSA